MKTSRSIQISVRHPSVTIDRTRLRRIIRELDKACELFNGGCPPGELSLVVLTDLALARLHGRFLDDSGVTDVITFSGDPAAGLAGEICVSADAAIRFSGDSRGKTFTRELTLYIVHGWLHLAGYDDLKPELKRRMRRAEARAMKLLAKAGL